MSGYILGNFIRLNTNCESLNKSIEPKHQKSAYYANAKLKYKYAEIF